MLIAYGIASPLKLVVIAFVVILFLIVIIMVCSALQTQKQVLSLVY